MKIQTYFFRLQLVIVLFHNTVLSAQDPHFSQFYSSPLTLNPAMTGVFSGDVRMATTYRNQWRTVSTPFTTATVASDFQLLNDKIGNDLFGVGILAMIDQSNNQGLKANYISISTAYNKSLDIEGYHRLGVGFQASWATKKVDYSRFVFSRQFTPQGFNTALSNGEPISGFNINYLDVGAGIMYSGMSVTQSQWYFGASYYHINKPNESISTEESRLSPRISVHGGYNFPFGEMNRLYLSGLYMNSMLTTEVLMGVVYEKVVPNVEYETSLFSGLYYRPGDAIIPYIGLGTTRMQVGFSYDINISSLKTATKSRGGFELSVQMNLSRDEENAKIPKCYNRF
jgi:type IX secretion system PorP/SprF family membrane protein